VSRHRIACVSAFLLALAFMAAACPAALATGKYVALGDSIAEGWLASGPQHGYVGLYFTYLSMPANGGLDELSNRAVFGQSSTGLVQKQLPLALADINDASDTRVVTIDIGINDGWACPGTYDNPGCPFAANFTEALQQLNAALAADPGDEQLELMEYYNPASGTGTPEEQTTADRWLGTDRVIDCSGRGDELGLNDLIACIAERKGGVPVDVYPTFAAHGQAYMGDAVHPNDMGHAAIASLFEDPASSGVPPPAAFIPPTLTAADPTVVRQTTATTNGVINANGEQTSWYVEYGTTTWYGSQTTTASAGDGSVERPVAAALASLQAGTTYHYRLVATNAEGTTVGADQTLTTPAPPTATTLAADQVEAHSAIVHGSTNAHGEDTTYHFDYGPNALYGTSTPDTAVGHGTAPVATAAPLTGLQAGTTYHYRLVATNAEGTTVGADRTFTTPEPPTATTLAADQVEAHSATVHGSANAHGEDTTYHFDYSPDTAYGTSTPDTAAGHGTAPVATAAALTGLQVGTTYHYRLVATNAEGTTLGADQTFTTPAPPTATTVAADPVEAHSATVHGSTNAQGEETTYHFEYGPNALYGTSTPDTAAGHGTAPVATAAALTGLQVGTTYHYRLVATNRAGTTVGADYAFTTTAPPAVVTRPADQIETNSAAVHGSVNPEGEDTTYRFEYGLDTSYGTSTPETAAGHGTDPIAVAASLQSLRAGTTYHYRLVATNRAGSTAGADEILSTLTPPAPTGGSGSTAPTAASSALAAAGDGGLAPLAGAGVLTRSDVRLHRPASASRGLVIRVINRTGGATVAAVLTASRHVAPARATPASKTTAAVLGHATAVNATAGQVTLRLKPNATARQLLTRRRKLRTRLTITLTLPNLSNSTLTRRVTLTR
jgi:lysophospholipase L1-like esterase